MTKDLHEPKDAAWSFRYPEPSAHIALGEGRVYHEDAADLTLITFANGVYMSLRAARTLADKHNLRARVVDLRWLSPLNEELIIEQAAATGRVLVVDEGRRSGGVSEAIMSLLYERCRQTVVARRLTAYDTYIPLGAAANLVLPGESDIVRESLMVCGAT
jgi:2-oxoisovalerate dehydrogenase E1 component